MKAGTPLNLNAGPRKQNGENDREYFLFFPLDSEELEEESQRPLGSMPCGLLAV